MTPHELTKYHAARFVYFRQDEQTPSAKRKGKSLTWRQWWEDRFGEDYDEYVRRMKK